MNEITHSVWPHFIPNLTSNAGRSLTVANWQEVGTHTAAFDLTSLLMKPGAELLNQLPHMAAFTGWQGRTVLNAMMPSINRDGECTLRSIYDGARMRFSIDDILKLITKLNPHFVVLPRGVHQLDKLAWLSLPDTMLPFFSPEDLPESHSNRAFGVYLHYDAKTHFDGLLSQVEKYKGLPCYVVGDLELTHLQALAHKGVQYLTSDVPAQDACLGKVYTNNRNISLSNATSVFDVIDQSCKCPTCVQQLTQAYLCHLIEHTPLLCQRFLIQHNIHYCHTSFTPA